MERARGGGRGRGGCGSGCSARKAARRAIYPWINSQIIAVADTGNLSLLMLTIETHASEMNLVNIATALHRLARLAAGHPEATPLQPLLHRLAALARNAMQRMQAGTGAAHAQALSNIAWSFATLHFVDVPLLQVLTEAAHARIESFKPFELTMILWAFAKLGTLDPAAWDSSSGLFKKGADELLRHPEDFTFRCLVMSSWAFATAGWRQPALFRGLAPHLARLAAEGSCRELASAVWALGSAGVREETLCQELDKKASLQHGTEDIAAVLGHLLSGGPFEPCPEKARAGLRKKVPQLGSPCSGRSPTGGFPATGRGGAAPPRGGRGRGGAGGVQRRNSTGAEAGGSGPGAASHGGEAAAGTGAGEESPGLGWGSEVVVKNGFLHVLEQEDDTGAVGRSGYPQLRPLGPSLNIFPPDVCPEKLEAYRLDYQRFRAGRAAGARGEVVRAVGREEAS